MKFLTTLALSALLCTLTAQDPYIQFTLFSSGYQQPVDIAHAGDSRLFIVERRGVISIADSTGNKLPQPFLDIQLRVGSNGSERGLLGLAFHPEYKSNGYFFVNYTDNSGDTRVSRFEVSVNPDSADENSEDLVIRIPQDFPNHNGGCVKFGPDGYLYIGMGDGGSGGDPLNRAQNRKHLLGKMLRIDIDVDSGYVVPQDNPFVGDTNYLPEIWALGLRNPWRFSFDRATGDMWIGDVGQGQWEEVDFEPAGSSGGLNYGWRCYEGFATYNTNGCQPANAYEPPVFDFAHGNPNSCSITGGFVYRGARYKSLWGTYIVADYCSGIFWGLRDNGVGFDTFDLGNHANFQFTAFGEDACGELYVTRYNGNIMRIEDTTCTPKAFVTLQESLEFCEGDDIELSAACAPGLQYQWYMNEVQIPNATQPVYVPTSNDHYWVVVTNDTCADSSDVVQVTIHPLPTAEITMADTMFVQSDPPVTMTATPPGGTFSGNGVSSNMFDPGAAGFGTHTIYYNYIDSNGCAAADSQLVIVDFAGIDGPLDRSAYLFPNPALDALSVALHLPYSSQLRLTIHDALGKLLVENVVQSNSGTHVYQLSVAALPASTYVLAIETDRERAVRKFVIQR